MMASEPGAEDSDLHQMQMLRQRSGTRGTRRVAPLDTSVSARRSSIHEQAVLPIAEESERQCSTLSAPKHGCTLSASTVNKHDAQTERESHQRSKIAAPATCTDAPDVTGPDHTVTSQSCRRLSVASIRDGRPSRRTSVTEMLLARTRRNSLGAEVVSRRGSVQAISRRASIQASRRASVSAVSRRGSLSDMHLSLQSTTVSQCTSLAAAAAFLLTDVSAEPGLQDIRPARSRTRCCSFVSSSPDGASAEQLPAEQLAVMRTSLLGAVGGEAAAAGRLRSSIRKSSCPSPPMHRGSTGTVGVPSKVSDAMNTASRDAPTSGDCDGVNEMIVRCLERRASNASTSCPAGVARTSMLSTISASISRHNTSSLGGGIHTPSVASSMSLAAPLAAARLSIGATTNTTKRPSLEPLSHAFVDRRCSQSASSVASQETSRWTTTCECLCSWYDHSSIVIHPLSRLRLYWDGLVALLSLYTLVEVPVRVVFDPENRFSFWSCSSINYGAIFVFILQPLVDFRTIVIKRGAPESRPSSILWHYIHSAWIMVDAVSATCIVLDLIWAPLALTCCIRLLYALNYVHKLEKATKTSPSVIRSTQCLLVFIPSLHWFACVFCYLSLTPGSWLNVYEESRGENITGSSVRTYWHALYWTLDTASTRGSGEITVTSDLEVLMMCVIITLSTLMYSAIIANMSTLLLSSDATWNDHRRRVEVLKAFMRHRKLPTRLRQRIQNFLDYMWATQKGINEANILQELPATLQKQVTLHCARGIIEQVPLFQNCSPDVSASIISSLVPRVYVPQDLITERGALGDDFFIISEGVVVQLDVDAMGDTTPSAYLHAGSYFGELSALLGGQRHESILALTHCFLYSLNHAALEDILHRHPECIDNMLANMMNGAYNIDEIKARLGEVEAAAGIRADAQVDPQGDGDDTGSASCIAEEGESEGSDDA